MYIFIVILITLAVAVIHNIKVKNNQTLQLDGLANIGSIKLLISLVQKHRGLSSAKLNGDNAKSAEIATIERTINNICHDLSHSKVAKNHRWVSFLDHWGRLTNNNTERDPQNNFKQHTTMIANLLYVLEDEAESSHLSSLSLPTMPNVGFVWRELVASTEAIGQTRAIGVGVATIGNCNSVDKIRLSFLEQNIIKTSKDTLSKLSCLDDFRQQHNTLLTNAQNKMLTLSKIIEDELIKKQTITINPNDYFTLATDTISAIDDIFDNQIEQIKIAL